MKKNESIELERLLELMEVVRFEDVATFLSKLSTSYRTKLLRSGDRIEFWFEYRENHQQWYVVDSCVSISDFVRCCLLGLGFH